jgi:hypothetical protein
MQKLGNHTTLDAETKRSVEWLDGRDEVTKIILSDHRVRSHSKTPGSLAVKSHTDTGLCLTAYTGVGIRQIFVSTPKRRELETLITERWPLAPRRAKTAMEVALEKASTNGEPKAEPKVTRAYTKKAPPPPPVDVPIHLQGARISSDVEYHLVEVTPELALDWLTVRNKVNRKTAVGHVATFVGIIKQGFWDPEAGVIMFDKDGNLINGQHRLQAIIETMTPVRMRVAYNVGPETRGNIDTIQKRRSDSDISRMLRGAELPPIYFSVATRAYYRGQRRGGSTVRLLPGERQEIMAKWQDAVEFALAAGRNNNKLLLSAGLAVLARASFTVSHEKLREFGKVLSTAMPSDESHQPIMLLYRWLSSNRKTREEARNIEVYRKTARALKAFLSNEEMDKLYSTKDEFFPVPPGLEAAANGD